MSGNSVHRVKRKVIIFTLLLLVCSCKQQQLAHQQTVYIHSVDTVSVIKTDTVKLYTTDTIRINNETFVDIIQTDTFIYVVDDQSGDTIKTQHMRNVERNNTTINDKTAISDLNKETISKNDQKSISNEKTDSISNKKEIITQNRQNRFQQFFMWLGIGGTILFVIKILIFLKGKFL